ncbi:hypothetical protein BJV82DRAFT_621025 [Fennellomyces sp. T-0311]|nr:hypothetical protein BJV82DRAFT_621025 [Fennellomyces sp. T-0311]
MTQLDLSGKVAVVTGAGSGIGKAAAFAFVERGAKVVIGDISQESGEAVVEELNEKAGSKVAAFQQTDVAKYKDNIALFQLAEKEFGGVDIVYLNAGTGKGWDSLFTELNDEEDESVFNINLMGVVKGTKVAVLHLAKRGGGVIINTSSIAGLFPSNLASTSYAASKHAVVGWTRGFDLLPQICNIRVNTVCPAFVSTNFMSSSYNDKLNTPFYATNPITPSVSVDTVVKAVLNFIEDESLNGQTFMALPGEIVRAQPRPDFPVECITPEYLEAMMKVDKDSISYYQGLLKTAQEKYENSL